MKKGFKTYRHDSNWKEKEIHDKLVEENSYDDFSMIVFPPDNSGFLPSENLTPREVRIAISAIQWVGSPVGREFLHRCGFILKEE